MVVNRIDTSDISVVVQGAIDKENTPKCLKSLRKYLPGAEIILSTWEGSQGADGLDCDSVLYNKDPGGYKDRYVKTFTNNTLRELVSSQNGVNKAKNKYIMKIRSDLIFESADFLSFFDSFPKRDKQFTLFEHRVIVPTFFTKKYLRYKDMVQPVPFHISDWLSFGLAQDIRRIYNIDMPEEPDFSWYLFDNPYHGKKINLLNASHRYTPEQYFTYAAFKSKFEIEYNHYMDYNKDNILFSEQLLANNYIILSPNQFKFVCGKKKAGTDYYKRWCERPSSIPSNLWLGLCRYYVFLQDYKKYCDTNYSIPQKYVTQNNWDRFTHKIYSMIHGGKR